MKTCSLVLLLLAGMALVLLGCSDNSGPVAGSNDPTLSTPTSPTALAKGGWVMTATGRGQHWWFGTHATLAFTAQKDADGICKGQIEVHDRAWGEGFHLKVTHLVVVENQAYMVGYGMLPELPKEWFLDETENIPAGPGYGMVLLTDNGQGKKAELPDQQSYFALFPDNQKYQSTLAILATASIDEMKAFFRDNYGWPENAFLLETNMGNTIVRSR